MNSEFTLPHLILGRMPQGATPDRARPAGPWCFAGQEEFFPDWEEVFLFPPEPLADAARASAAAEEAQALCAMMIWPVAKELCDYATALPPVYWETLLAPWAIMAATQIVERYHRVQALLEAWGETELCVPLVPQESSFTFATEQDAVLYGALGTEFNHWLFSRLLEAQWPAAWKKEYIAADSYSYPLPAASSSLSLAERIKKQLRGRLLHWRFPPLKEMGIGQALRLSWALRHPLQGNDHSRSLVEAFAQNSIAQSSYPFALLPLFMALLPQSLRMLVHPPAIKVSHGRPQLRIASIAAYEDTAYRQFLAVWRAEGHRLMFVQHGGNYGQIATACSTAVVEYTQHAFATWGWKQYSPRGMGTGQGPLFFPCVHPQLVKIKDKWRGDGAHLLVVGAEMPLYAYRLDARPTPLQVVQYRDDKQWFMEALPQDIQDVTRYRPYFMLPGALEDAEWLLPRFPHVRLCTGPLEPQMLSCRLMVVDHSSTTLLQALVANVPTIAFWTKEVWPQTEEADRFVQLLEHAGIWHPTAESAAAKVYEVWENPAVWWQSGPVQEARQAFCRQYAWVHENATEQWLSLLQQL